MATATNYSKLSSFPALAVDLTSADAHREGDASQLLEVKRVFRIPGSPVTSTTLPGPLRAWSSERSSNQNLWIDHPFEGAAYLPR